MKRKCLAADPGLTTFLHNPIFFLNEPINFHTVDQRNCRLTTENSPTIGSTLEAPGVLPHYRISQILTVQGGFHEACRLWNTHRSTIAKLWGTGDTCSSQLRGIGGEAVAGCRYELK